MIQVYTGNGKGKTTAAVGLAVRAVGAGQKVVFVQFLKGRKSSEIVVLENLGVRVFRFGKKEFVNPKNPVQTDFNEAKKAFDKVAFFVKDPSYNLVIADEILIAVSFKLISEQEVIKFLKSCPKDKELVLTGRGATPKIMRASDLVTEMKNIKHPFDKGVVARLGMEF